MRTFTLIMLALAITACNTVSGVGKDIQRASDWTAEKTGLSK